MPGDFENLQNPLKWEFKGDIRDVFEAELITVDEEDTPSLDFTVEGNAGISTPSEDSGLKRNYYWGEFWCISQESESNSSNSVQESAICTHLS